MSKKKSKETEDIHTIDRWIDSIRSKSSFKLAMLAAQLSQGKDPEKYIDQAFRLLTDADHFLWVKDFEDSMNSIRWDIDKTLRKVGLKKRDTLKKYLHIIYPNQPELVERLWKQALEGERVFTQTRIELIKKVKKNIRSERAKKGQETRRAKSQKAVKKSPEKRLK